jgi:hypothetical protein
MEYVHGTVDRVHGSMDPSWNHSHRIIDGRLRFSEAKGYAWSNHVRWSVSGCFTVSCSTTVVRQWFIDARRPRHFGAPDDIVPSLNRREGHDNSHRGLILAQETVVKARDSRVTSLDLIDGDDSLRRSPSSKAWSNSFAVGSSSAS